MQDEALCVCEYCGEDLVVPVDASAGPSQQFVQDCAVCCSPSVVHVEIDEDGAVHAWAEGESD